MQITHSLDQLKVMATHTQTLSDFIQTYGLVSDGLVLTYQGSLIAVWKIGGQDPEGKNLEDLEATLRQQGRILMGLEGIFYFWLDRKKAVGDVHTGGDPFYQALVKERGQRQQFLVNHLYLAIEWPLGGQADGGLHDMEKSWLSIARGLMGRMRRSLARDKVVTIEMDRLKSRMNELEERIRNIEVGFDSWGLQRLRRQDCFNALACIYNPNRDVSMVTPALLNVQLEGSAYHYQKTHFQLGDRVVDMLSLRHLPVTTQARMIAILEEVDYPIMVSAIWRVMDDDKARGVIKRQQRAFHQKIRFSLGKDEGDVIEEGASNRAVSQLDVGLTSLTEGTHRFGSMSLFIRITGDDLQTVRERRAHILKLMLAEGLGFLYEDMGNLYALASMGPGSFHLTNYRKVIGTQMNFLHLAPIWKRDQGRLEGRFGGPLSVLRTREGSPYRFHFGDGDNLNALILGKIGSGKSFFIKYHLIQFLQYGQAFLWVHTLGPDYHDLARLVGGGVLEVDPDGSHPIFLYGGVLSGGRLSMLIGVWRELLNAMDHRLTEEEQRVLEEALKNLFRLPEKDRNQGALVELVGDSGLKRLVREFQKNPIYQGRYGSLFDGDPGQGLGVDFQKPLTVVDYQKASKEPAIARAVMAFLTFEMDQIIYESRWLNKPKVCVFDEGHKILSHGAGYMKEYLQTAADTWRKHGAALVFGTQTLDHLKSMKMDRVFRNGCGMWLFFGNPGLDGAELFDLFGKELFNENDVDTIRNLTFKREVLAVTATSKKVLRLEQVDPFTLMVLSSDPKDVAAKQALIRKGVAFPENIRQAIAAHAS